MVHSKAITKMGTILLIAGILVAAILFVVLELRWTGENKLIGSPFNNSEQFLNETHFGYLINNSKAESPVGIATYGIYNYSGSLESYSINSSEIIGEANISSISAFTTWNDSIFPSFSALSCVQCASLQMNVNAIVRTKDGEQIFWIQNVLAFSNTSTDKVLKPEGIIWNLTTANSNMSTNTVGNGYRSPLGNNIVYSSTSFFNGQEVDYTLPLHVRMTTSIYADANGVTIQLSNHPFGNGTLSRDNDTFLTAYFPSNNVISASIVVTTSLYPWRYNTIGYPTFDSEIVWTGYCCGQTTKFVEMNSNLSLMYFDSEGHLVWYPSFYTFGEVEETASNLRVIPIQGGGHVVTGENNNTYLGT